MGSRLRQNLQVAEVFVLGTFAGMPVCFFYFVLLVLSFCMLYTNHIKNAFIYDLYQTL
jgi:hypothetical protein